VWISEGGLGLGTDFHSADSCQMLAGMGCHFSPQRHRSLKASSGSSAKDLSEKGCGFVALVML
jgi:hypothetical protein